MEKKVLKTIIGKKGDKKFKIEKNKQGEQDADIDIISGTPEDIFIVEKLSQDGLDPSIGDQEIVWFTNFVIKKQATGDPINQRYKIKISGLGAWRGPNKKIVIQDGNANEGQAYEFTGDVTDDTIELTDGDPGVGGSPPMA